MGRTLAPVPWLRVHRRTHPPLTPVNTRPRKHSPPTPPRLGLLNAPPHPPPGLQPLTATHVPDSPANTAASYPFPKQSVGGGRGWWCCGTGAEPEARAHPGKVMTF